MTLTELRRCADDLIAAERELDAAIGDESVARTRRVRAEAKHLAALQTFAAADAAWAELLERTEGNLWSARELDRREGP